MLAIVIASEPKQSSYVPDGATLDCFVAPLPAMTRRRDLPDLL
jgi:hypothetical protein